MRYESLDFISSDNVLQAESIREAAWMCDWVGAPLSAQKDLILMIAVSTKDFTFTAGKFVAVSRETMMKVSNNYKLRMQ